MNTFVVRLLFIFLISVVPAVVYTVNPFNITTENIRPRLFGFDFYRIPSNSMLPTLIPGDYIIVSNVAYPDREPNRNDIIIFNRISAEDSNKKHPFIKRVLAANGDVVKIREGTVFVNNKAVKEDYVKQDSLETDYSQNMKEKTVPPGMLFVLGDNRDNSADSRIFGFVSVDSVIGKAITLLYGKNGRSGNQIK